MTKSTPIEITFNSTDSNHEEFLLFTKDLLEQRATGALVHLAFNDWNEWFTQISVEFNSHRGFRYSVYSGPIENRHARYVGANLHLHARDYQLGSEHTQFHILSTKGGLYETWLVSEANSPDSIDGFPSGGAE